MSALIPDHLISPAPSGHVGFFSASPGPHGAQVGLAVHQDGVWKAIPDQEHLALRLMHLHAKLCFPLNALWRLSEHDTDALRDFAKVEVNLSMLVTH